MEFAKNELSITDNASLASIFEKLSDFVHPLVLGEVYRSKAQIQMMAEQLIQNQVTDPDKIKKIIAFLCSESGSHDYTINRREAQNELGLNVKKPSPEQYELIKKLYDDINDELLFSKPFMLTEVNCTDNFAPIFTELSKNRKAALFRYVLLDEIDRKFTSLSSELVISEIRNGKVPLIIDGFDELISRSNKNMYYFINCLDTITSILGLTSTPNENGISDPKFRHDDETDCEKIREMSIIIGGG